MIRDENRTDWIATTHAQVYYRSNADKFGRGEYKFAKHIADHIPEWTITITMGPYRGHDIRHTVYPDRRLLHLDFYSVAMRICGPDCGHRPQHPADEHGDSVLNDIIADITNSQNSD